MAEIPELLQLESLGEARYRVPMPAGSQEGLHVVFGGQIMAQMIMAVNESSGGAKYVKSMSTVFSRAGSYAEPLELQVESFQNGRSWAGDVVTAWQNERMLTKALVLSTVSEPDLISHDIDRPTDVLSPQEGELVEATAFPGAEVRMATPKDQLANGVPAMSFWTRMPGAVGSVAASQAILAWATNGWLIELTMRNHRDTVKIEDSHQTLMTGVIGHTINFHSEFDAGSWVQVAQEGTWAGRGRIHGRGLCFLEDGTLVASFSQDSMVKDRGETPGGKL